VGDIEPASMESLSSRHWSLCDWERVMSFKRSTTYLPPLVGGSPQRYISRSSMLTPNRENWQRRLTSPKRWRKIAR
jgi:hypothetical protein